MSDEEIIKLAQKEKRMIITHDLDFGEVYHFRQEGKVGILVLRLRDQTIESVNKILEKFLAKRIFKKQKLARSLITLAETSYRVYQKSN